MAHKLTDPEQEPILPKTRPQLGENLKKRAKATGCIQIKCGVASVVFGGTASLVLCVFAIQIHGPYVPGDDWFWPVWGGLVSRFFFLYCIKAQVLQHWNASTFFI